MVKMNSAEINNANTEDKIFLEIKEAMSKLNAKKVKVYLEGRNDMISRALRNSYRFGGIDLDIEGKEVVFSYDRENLMHYDRYRYFIGKGVLLDTPYITKTWGDHNRESGLLDNNFQPSDIRKITYRKKVVYSKD